MQVVQVDNPEMDLQDWQDLQDLQDKYYENI